MSISLNEILSAKESRIFSVDPETSIDEAVRMMNRERIGSLLVMSGDDLLGIFTERDLLNRVIVAGMDLKATPVHEVMTREVVVVKPDLAVNDAMRIVTEKRLRHLPVMDEGRLVGMVSSGDLTRSLAAEGDGVIHSLMAYINGSYPG